MSGCTHHGVSLHHRRSDLRPSLDSSSTLAVWMGDVSAVSVSSLLTRCLSMSLHPGTAKLPPSKCPQRTIQACRRVLPFKRMQLLLLGSLPPPLPGASSSGGVAGVSRRCLGAPQGSAAAGPFQIARCPRSSVLPYAVRRARERHTLSIAAAPIMRAPSKIPRWGFQMRARERLRDTPAIPPLAAARIGRRALRETAVPIPTALRDNDWTA
jgi:hypothetical protein